MIQEDKKKLQIFKRNVLKKMYRPVINKEYRNSIEYRNKINKEYETEK